METLLLGIGLVGAIAALVIHDASKGGLIEYHTEAARRHNPNTQTRQLYEHEAVSRTIQMEKLGLSEEYEAAQVEMRAIWKDRVARKLAEGA